MGIFMFVFLLFDNLLGPFDLGRKHKFRNMLAADLRGNLEAGTSTRIPLTVPFFEHIDQPGHIRGSFPVKQFTFFVKLTRFHTKIRFSIFSLNPGLSGASHRQNKDLRNCKHKKITI